MAKHNFTWRTLTLTAALVLGACGSTDSAELTEPDVTIDSAPTAIASDANGAALQPSTSEASSGKPDALTTVEQTTTTTEAPTEPVALDPADVEGAVAEVLNSLTVVTAADDPLNVRTGPGIDYDVVSQLEHRTDEVTATHRAVLDSGAVWRFVEVDGDARGWVHGGYLQGPLIGSAACQNAPDPSKLDSLVATVLSADVDRDGEFDTIELYSDLVEPGQFDTYDLWIVIGFNNGGVASGRWDGGPIGDVHPASSIRTTDLSWGAYPDRTEELIVQIGQGASHGQFGIMALDGCDIVTTTLDGEPFGYQTGASGARGSGVSCVYLDLGVELHTSSVNWEENTGQGHSYVLNGTTWVEVAAYDITPGHTPAFHLDQRCVSTMDSTTFCVADDVPAPYSPASVAPLVADVDNDGLDDAVTVYRNVGDDLDEQRYLEIEFGTGGRTVHAYDGAPHPIATGVAVANLTTLPGPADPSEILVQIGQGATTSVWQVLTMHGCHFSQTLFDGEPFGFSVGAGGTYSLSAGCGSGPHGEVEFMKYSDTRNPDFSYTLESYELRGFRWTLLGTSGSDEFPGYEPPIPYLNDCAIVG